MKIHLTPHIDDISENNGIGQVVKAQYELLPQFGFEFVHNPGKADIIASHVKTDLDYLDVLHCHGLYWTAEEGSWSKYHHWSNLKIAEAARKARKITVPSQWVAEVFKRDMRVNPEVIGHGINLEEWSRGRNDKYILWNKNRVSPACDPSAINFLFSHGLQTVSTFGLPQMNPIGVQSFDSMKQYIQNAGIYLSTAKETFGIGTLEALACGVPVLGYDIGGNSDIIQHGENGYLVEEGNLEGLLGGYAYIMGNYAYMSKRAAETSRAFSWLKVMRQYAKVYKSILEPETHKTALIITNFNYGKYLLGAIESARTQTLPFDEVIIVDDGSTDDSRLLFDFAERFGYKIILQKNQGVASARNAGIRASEADYICCLDADDKLHPDFLRKLLPEIKSKREIGIVYSGLVMFKNDGSQIRSNWPPEFSWETQSSQGVPPPNCIPSACLFRREMWERAGGVIQQGETPGEDVEFWTRGLSVGFEAKKVTNDPLFLYRLHEGQAHKSKRYQPIDSYLPWINTKDFPFASPSKTAPKVKSYSSPSLSIIIPVGPGHENHLRTAVNSIMGQSFQDWELIVVNDSGGKIDSPSYTRVIDCQSRSAGAARNLGVKHSKGEIVYFLDADDYLLPDGLQVIIDQYAKMRGSRYIYTAYGARGRDGKVREARLRPYQRDLWKGQHAVNILINKKDFEISGGFDETLSGWEDYDFQLKLQTLGICGYYLDKFTFVYRQDEGSRRKHSFENKEKLLKILKSRYGGKLKNMSEDSCCNSEDNEKLIEILLRSKNRRIGFQSESSSIMETKMNGIVRMEYVGKNTGAIPFSRVGNSPLSKTYRGGASPSSRFADATESDSVLLVQTGKWKIVDTYESSEGGLSVNDVPLPGDEAGGSQPASEVIDSEPGEIVGEVDEAPEILASSKVKEEAEALGVDLSLVRGTGKHGRITMADVRNF